MPTEPSAASDSPITRGRIRWLTVTGAALLGVVCLAVGGVLGMWQWDRAHRQSAPVEADPPAPIADVMRPGEPGGGEGRLVLVDGQWADEPAALVDGKEVDGVPAVLLIVALAVPADQTGTGVAGTLPVLMGWMPADDLEEVPHLRGDASVGGYVRGGEGFTAAPDRESVEGAVWLGSMTTAALAQQWAAPVYSYLVVADEPADGWSALPDPPDAQSLDFRSLTYSLEWWVFGIFGALLAGRFIRDNGRASRDEEDS